MKRLRRSEPEFFALHAPQNLDVLRVAEVLVARVPALVKRRACDLDPGDAEEREDGLRREDPWLSDVIAASITGRIATGPHAGTRVQAGGDRVDPEALEAMSSERCSRVSGFSVHANVAVPAGDRARLERLCRYVARPPLASERLEILPDGRLAYEFKRPWRDGTSRIFLRTPGVHRKAIGLGVPAAHTSCEVSWRACAGGEVESLDRARYGEAGGYYSSAGPARPCSGRLDAFPTDRERGICCRPAASTQLFVGGPDEKSFRGGRSGV